MTNNRIFEKEWKCVNIPELDDLDLSDILLSELGAFRLMLEAKYPGHRFGLACDFEYDVGAYLYAERLETDAELQRRVDASNRMKERHRRKSA